MAQYQQSMFGNRSGYFNAEFPSTRYQGSKRKLVDWISESVSSLEFDSVLDVFGGTGAVSHQFKALGKTVTYNDLLHFNWLIGVALIQNSDIILSTVDIDNLLREDDAGEYPSFISDHFQNVFFYPDENRWLDRTVYRIKQDLIDPIKQALAFFALFQSCLVKRPYNLFHRANLYMREADVERSFGNKITWDTPFPVHFRKYAQEANLAVFNNGKINSAINVDAFDTPTGFDLVYLDPPYLNQKGIGVDYRDFYHFLEGIARYHEWGNLIDTASKHKRLIPNVSVWNQPKSILSAFERVIERHRKSIIVISYRDDGIPTKAELITMLKRHKKHVHEAEKAQKYALSKRDSHEILLIATD